MMSARALQRIVQISALTLFLCNSIAVSAPLTSTRTPSGGTAVQTDNVAPGVSSMESTSSANMTPDKVTLGTSDNMLMATVDSTEKSTSLNTGDTVSRITQLSTQEMTLSNITTRDRFTKHTTTVKTTTTISAKTTTPPFNIGTITRRQTMPNSPSDPSSSTQQRPTESHTTTDIIPAALADDDDKVSMSDSQKTALIIGIILLAVVIVMVTAIAMYWRHRRYRQWQPATGEAAENKQYKMMCYARRKDGPVFCEIDAGDIEEVATVGTVKKTTNEQGMNVEQNKNGLVATGGGGGHEAQVFIAESKLQADGAQEENGDVTDDTELDSNKNMAAVVKRSSSSRSSTSASRHDKHSSETELNQVDVIDAYLVIHDNDDQIICTDSSHTDEAVTHEMADERLDDTHDDTHEMRSDDTYEVRSDDTYEVRSDDTCEVWSDDTSEVRSGDTREVQSDDTREVQSDDTREVRSDDTREGQSDHDVYHVEPPQDVGDRESPSVESRADTSPNTSMDLGHNGDDPYTRENGSVEPLQNVDNGNVTSDLSDVEPYDPVRIRKDPDIGSEEEFPDASLDKHPAGARSPDENRDADIVVHDSPIRNDDFTGRGEHNEARGEVIGERGDVLVEQRGTDNGEIYTEQDTYQYQPREGEPE